MKKVYIAHPLTTHGTVADNKTKIERICKALAEVKGIVPISPIHAFSFFDTEGDQTVVMACCKALLESCDELWLYGNWQGSSGCVIEYAHALSHNIPIRLC